MDQFIGSALFSLFVVALLIGAWIWVVVLFKKGIRGLLGFDRVIVQRFENVLLYKNGNFESALLPGTHWVRIGNRQLVRIDMRSEVFRLTQGAISSDHFAVNLLYVVRTQIVDPRASFESTKNYKDEIFVRLQSIVKSVCAQKPRLGIQMNHDDFNNSAQKAANLALLDIGCECTTFELLQVESTGPLRTWITKGWDSDRTSSRLEICPLNA